MGEHLDKLAEEIKKTAKEKGDEMSDEDALDGARNMVDLAELFWEIAQRETKMKNRLKKEPGGFPVESGYSCMVCGAQINETNGWYDWYGYTCLLCRKAIQDGVIPTFVCRERESYFAMWALKYHFDIKYQTAKKYIRELKPRIILNENGKPHEYIFLKKENPKLIHRYNPTRKSYDRNREKVSKARSREMIKEMLQERRKSIKKRK